DRPAHHRLDELLASDDVRARLLGLGRLRTLRERGHADRLARAVRQRDRASDELVGLARVDAEPERDLDGLVEPGIGESLEGPDRVDRRVLASAIGQLGCLYVPFA